MGLVSQVFDESTLASLKGHLAVGHARYSTTGASTWHNAQPTFRPTETGSIALAHNGNLTNTRELAQRVAGLTNVFGELDLPVKPTPAATNDTSLVTALLAHHPDMSLEENAVAVLPGLRGAFSFVWMDENTLYAARDPQGVRPLVLGRLERGWVVASETAALDIVGASFIRELEPGEMVAIDEDGLRSRRFAEAAPKHCLFEFVYLARPDTLMNDKRVHSVRVEIGRRLAREFPTDADLVMPVPESGTPGRDRLRRGERHPLRHRPGEELLRRAHVHPAVADDPAARHPAQAQPAARRDRGQAARGRRRLDRARQHPARPGPDAPRGRRPRGARADLLAAGEVAVLLRHRLRDPRRADRQRPDLRRDLPLDRRGLARLHLPGAARRGHHGADAEPVPGLLRRGLPDRAARPRAPRQAPPGVRPRPSRRTSTACRPRCPAAAPATPSNAPDRRRPKAGAP